MRIKCESCGATISNEVPIWATTIKCEYCGSIINIQSESSQFNNKLTRQFNLNEFNYFLKTKKHINTFDSISGVLILGNNEAVISEKGIVNAEPMLKNRIEKWIHEFLTS